MSSVPTAIQHATRGPSSPLNFRHIFDIPVEILEHIIEEVAVLDDDTSEIKNNNIRFVRGWTVCEMHSNDQPSILNTLQSLAVVNRKFHRLCRPRLWKTLYFPSALPTLMSDWDNILFKCGAFVRSIEIELSESWLSNVRDELGGPDCDNLIIHDDSRDPIRRGLSLRNTMKVLDALPNLESLDITLPPMKKIEIHEHEDTTAIQHDPRSAWVYPLLKIIISYLPGLLRSLAFNGCEFNNYRTPDSYVIGMIKCLPLLEHLKCEKLCRSTPESADQAELFEWHLAQLSNLSSLDLSLCENFDLTWSKQTWPKKIKSLKIILCSKISLDDLHQLIPHFAPELITLSVGISVSEILYIVENFLIPTITQLNPDGLKPKSPEQSPTPITQSRDYRRILPIEQRCIRRSEWGPISVLSGYMWPHFKSMNFSTPPVDEEEEAFMGWCKLQKFCKINNIKFVYYPVIYE